MRKTWCLFALSFPLLLLALVLPAVASPISISFDTITDFEQPGGGLGGTSTVPSGEPDNDVGLQLPGQVGSWNSLVVGNGAFTVTYSAQRSITVSGITFKFDVGGTNTYQTFADSLDPLRSTVAFLRANAAGGQFPAPATSPSLTWQITGLTPGTPYNLILFGQEQTSDDNAVNPANFSIVGYDAGNGIGNPVTLDAENDGNFTSVLAVGGTITGTFALQPGQGFAGWAGLQIQAVPEPASLTLAALGVLALASKGWRRCKQTT